MSARTATCAAWRAASNASVSGEGEREGARHRRRGSARVAKEGLRKNAGYLETATTEHLQLEQGKTLDVGLWNGATQQRYAGERVADEARSRMPK